MTLFQCLIFDITGTVKLFDLRIKTKCDKEFCNDDTLIKTSVGITSMDVCSSSPHIACGCIDGIVRFYDRRFLTISKNNNNNNTEDSENHEMFAIFNFYDFINVDETKRRITSIHYDKNGDDLLVSYQPGNVVLLDLKNLIINEKCFKNQTDMKSSQHARKFRVQASWNDTGPNSRPNSTATSNENSRYRFLNLIDNWIEERLNTSNSSNNNLEAVTEPLTDTEKEENIQSNISR